MGCFFSLYNGAEMKEKDQNYISSVIDTIVSCSICASMVGPETYTAAAEWEKEGIPLTIVTSSIDKVCCEHIDKETASGSIENLKAVVQAGFANWLREMN